MLRGRKPHAALALFILLAVARAAHAAPGDSDPAFGGFGSDGDKIISGRLTDVALQPDQKILVLQSGGGLNIRRLLPNGDFDPTFGGDGKVDISHPIFNGALFLGIAVQADGKIVAAGYTYPSPIDYLIVRITASGSLDPSFSGDGIVTVDFDNDDDHGEQVVIQPDGMIVVGGWSDIDGDPDFTALRLFPDGSLDPDFGGDGQVTVPFGGIDICVDMALQPNGKIVLAGWSSGTFDQDWAIARLNADGSRDAGWGGDGKVTLGWGGDDTALAVAICPNGKIVVTGPEHWLSDDNDNGRMAVFTSTGSLDAVFGGDGKITNTESTCEDVIVQPNGRIVTIGQLISSSGDTRFAVHRRFPDGSLDTSFDSDGRTFPNFFGDEEGTDILIQPDGRILCAGITDSGTARTGLVRLWPDGAPDAGGFQHLTVGQAAQNALSNAVVFGMLEQPDGKLVVAGSLMNPAGTASDFALSRVLPNGMLDTAFGTAGHATFDLQSLDVARAAALQPDGKSIVAGYTGTTNPQFLVTRFASNGTLDPSFGTGGSATLDFAGGADFGRATAVAPDGKIVVAGTVHDGSAYVFGVARFDANGTADPSFDGDGKVFFNFGLPAQSADAVLVQPDGKIVVGGQANGNFALVRLLPTGAVDTAFGVTGAGTVITDLGGQDAIRAMALDGNGHIFAAGGGRSTADFTVAQYTATGQLAWCENRSCANPFPAGQAFADFGGTETATAIDVRDGRVVIAGCAEGRLAWAQFSTVNPANPIVSIVDMPGGVECDTPGTSSQGSVGVQFLFSDKVVTAATSSYDGNRTFALAGFETSAAAVSDARDDDSEDTAASITARLHPASPNPFSSQSLLAFDLPRAEAAQVRIYNAGGRLVRTLTRGDLTAGRHQATWDAKDDHGIAVAAGVYYVRLETTSSRAQRPVVLVR